MNSPADIKGAAVKKEPRPVPAQWRAVLDALPVPAYTCDADGRVNYYNRHAAEAWGRAPSLGEDAMSFCGSFRLRSLDGKVIPHEECYMALALRERKPYNAREVVVEREDGSQIVALAHCNPVFGDDGEFLGAFNLIVDITPQKAAERKLQELDRHKTEFLATLSHELRNPLAPINAVAQLLRGQGEDKAGDPRLAILERQLAHLNRLVDDLLDLSRIETSRLELRKSRIDLRDVVAAAIETVQPELSRRSQRIDYMAPSARLSVDGDAVRLAQALTNLLNNASKFSGDGAQVSVSLDSAGPLAVITVIDHGAGISADALSYIFEPFRQGPEGKARVQGLGIGLALVKRICELHGGSVAAHSDGAGRGSKFTITLPLAASAA